MHTEKYGMCGKLKKKKFWTTPTLPLKSKYNMTSQSSNIQELQHIRIIIHVTHFFKCHSILEFLSLKIK